MVITTHHLVSAPLYWKVSLSPLDASFYRRLGESLASSNIKPISDAHYTSGTQGFPESEAVRERARRAFQSSRALAPSEAFEATVGLGNLFLDQYRDPATAAVWYAEATRLLPGSSIAQSNLATALMQGGDQRELGRVLRGYREVKLPPACLCAPLSTTLPVPSH